MYKHITEEWCSYLNREKRNNKNLNSQSLHSSILKVDKCPEKQNKPFFVYAKVN